ncbi:MAG: RNA-guided endonuclease InsQ/TnpB family protein [Candidatus Poribacteria bacterium]
MKIVRGYKVELKINKKQRTLLRKHAGAARFAWNWGLARRIEEYKTCGKSSNAIEQHRQLNALKKTEFPWMYEVSKCAPQEALRNLDYAFANFFRRVKKGITAKAKFPVSSFLNGSKKVGFPRFKSKKRGRGSFRLTGAIRVFHNRIKLPRIGFLRLAEQDYIPTCGVKILSATLSERADRWFVSVQVAQEISVSPATSDPIGVDLGVAKMATCSDGRVFENHRALLRSERKLKHLQRQLSRQKKESHSREKTRRKIAKLHFRIANQRSDAISKATSALVAKTKPPHQRPKTIVIEDLNVNGMLKNRKAVANVGMYEFRRQLEYKCTWYGSKLLVASRFYPSSKRCSHCGTIKEELPLDVRVFRCNNCSLLLDRDLNAAINLKKLAGSSSESENACGESVRPLIHLSGSSS